jgi:predicted Zn-dependent protease with MMP-like domain
MDDARFEELVAEALDSLPDKVIAVIDNLPVTIEDWPSEEQLAEADMEGADPSELLGLYEGVPLIERAFDHWGVPDRIVVFKGPILAAAGRDPDAIRHEVRVTVLHEVGHFLGLDEDRLDELGVG